VDKVRFFKRLNIFTVTTILVWEEMMYSKAVFNEKPESLILNLLKDARASFYRKWGMAHSAPFGPYFKLLGLVGLGACLYIP